MSVDWRSIRPLNGACDKGFEELCSQLARWEVADRARFIRKGNPDAGVECYAVYGNGSECAWQAKYIFTLGDSHWTQIDRSVHTALHKHPRLKRYVICLPIDLPDARVTGQESALAKWDARLEKWARWASERGMIVEFRYWGSSELLERLSKPEHIGRVRFWFGVTGFDEYWFERRLQEARQTAGPRYTPELHVNVPIADRFEAFGRSSRFFDQTISLIRGLAKEWASAWSPGPSRLGSEGDPEVEAWIKAVTDDPVVRRGKVSIGGAIEEIVAAGSEIEVQASGMLPFGGVAEMVTAVETAVDGVVQHLLARQEEHQVIHQFRHQFETLAGKLRKVREVLVEAQRWGGAAVMIVRGHAGTGKTHLLCDVAHRRLAEGRPTVMLMGQTFTSDATPWIQAAALLDVSDSSAEEIVGAIECAAQAAGARALVLIDALNEGKGLSVWPTHLSGFLAHFARSDWIGVVLSIRSSYDEVVPEAVRQQAVVATHRGFGERSYDAMRSFFTHYGLELPSTPLIAPEFGNPLFLKTLCLGLQGLGETRLRQGINGIAAVFEFYISSINKRVAKRLGLPDWNTAAEKALRALVRAFPAVSERWLAVEAAEELVNGLLPGRPYEESLYRMLVVEGVLVQEASRTARRGEVPEIVFIAYERLADHLITGALLDTHFDPSNAVAAFEIGGGLSELAEGGYGTQGILEALCIQLPGRTGQEVVDLVPRLAQAEGFEGAFEQSLVWRAAGTFSERTRDLVRTRLEPEVQGRYAILDALLTLACTPEHPLNARFLDARLREDALPTRDTWWTVYLQHATSGGQAATRLRDWALAVSPTTELVDELVDLCAMSLAWMLAASNRLVRDRATKALVNLLTGRLDAAARLVEGFDDVNDPYVAERVYAVAYGVTARSHDSGEVKMLAECVYSRAFASGAPPTNILLRDYARGVIERALYLKSPIEVDRSSIRPPYGSAAPVFPSDEDLAPLLPRPNHSPHKREGKDWARSHIGHSVLDGELHRVIEENWRHSGEWLLLGLDQPAWQEPNKLGKERQARAHWPVFDRRQIERYVLQRVFELGWTTERFGKFDRIWDFDGIGRFSTKESIGRKYQWIAYHEVLGLISDHFQYREYPAEVERCHRYVGPWQNGLRDIDPTLTATLPGGRPWHYYLDSAEVWWATDYDRWDDTDTLENWVRRHDDLERIEKLLIVRNPRDGTRWLTGNVDLRWAQKPPVGRSLFEGEDREVLCWITAFLTCEEDAPTFVEWFNAQPCPRVGIGEVAEMDGVFVGEHGWAPAAGHRSTQLEDARAGENAPVHLEELAAKYSFRVGPRDQSVSDYSWLHLPAREIVRIGGLRWSGHAGDFLDSNGNLAAFDPSTYAVGPSASLVREDFLRELMHRHKLGVVWTIRCMKTQGMTHREREAPSLRISGAYWLSEVGPVGSSRPEETTCRSGE